METNHNLTKKKKIFKKMFSISALTSSIVNLRLVGKFFVSIYFLEYSLNFPIVPKIDIWILKL